jgi:pimeloyl-ACP methyl ester carboxylesterase
VDDILEMKAHLLEELLADSQSMFVLQARSMGGAIATLLNELHGEEFDGILALGAALYTTPTEYDKVQWTYQPKTKQIFMANISELAVVEKYVEKCSSSAFRAPILQIQRFGHIAIFDSELKRGFEALLEWVRTNQKPALMEDATNYAESPDHEKAVWDEERKGYWSAMSVSMYWNILFDLTEENWLRLNIRPRKKFVAEFHTEHGMVEKELLFAVDPFVGVEEGQLVAFVKGVGQKSVIDRHYTGTKLSSVAKDLHIRREGNWIFVPQIDVRPKGKK